MSMLLRKILCPVLAACLLPAGLASCAFAGAESAGPSVSTFLEEGSSQVYGKVKSAQGNEIVLVLGTIATGSPGGGENSPPQASPETLDVPGGQDATPSQRSEDRGNGALRSPPQIDGEAAPGGSPSGGENAPAPGAPGAGGGMAVALEYTGGEATFQIPVTAAITTGTGENARSVRFTQIAEKNILRLVLDESGGIVSVQILA